MLNHRLFKLPVFDVFSIQHREQDLGFEIDHFSEQAINCYYLLFVDKMFDFLVILGFVILSEIYVILDVAVIFGQSFVFRANFSIIRKLLVTKVQLLSYLDMVLDIIHTLKWRRILKLGAL